MDLHRIFDLQYQASRAQVEAAAKTFEQVYFFALQRNRGKGGAVKAGFSFARSLGFTHAIQIDADGQHNVADIAEFVARSQANPTAKAHQSHGNHHWP